LAVSTRNQIAPKHRPRSLDVRAAALQAGGRGSARRASFRTTIC